MRCKISKQLLGIKLRTHAQQLNIFAMLLIRGKTYTDDESVIKQLENHKKRIMETIDNAIDS
jgi:hypothetical protein